MTVATRTTRPGQKRIGGLLEVDSNGGVLQSSYLALLDALAAELCDVITLAAPALTFNLTPSVFRKDAAGAVTAHQPVVGYVVSKTSHRRFPVSRAGNLTDPVFGVRRTRCGAILSYVASW